MWQIIPHFKGYLISFKGKNTSAEKNHTLGNERKQLRSAKNFAKIVLKANLAYQVALREFLTNSEKVSLAYDLYV